MLKRILKYKLRLVLSMGLIALLVLVRVAENFLFYDPFLVYFKSDFTNLPIPTFDSFKLFLSLCFRYGLNTVISLALLHVIFRDYNTTKFSLVLYLLFFMLFVLLFFVAIFYCESNKLAIFYVRRFLIQPIFVLLFIPGFYYQKLAR